MNEKERPHKVLVVNPCLLEEIGLAAGLPFTNKVKSKEDLRNAKIALKNEIRKSKKIIVLYRDKDSKECRKRLGRIYENEGSVPYDLDYRSIGDKDLKIVAQQIAEEVASSQGTGNKSFIVFPIMDKGYLTTLNQASHRVEPILWSSTNAWKFEKSGGGTQALTENWFK